MWRVASYCCTAIRKMSVMLHVLSSEIGLTVLGTSDLGVKQNSLSEILISLL